MQAERKAARFAKAVNWLRGMATAPWSYGDVRKVAMRCARRPPGATSRTSRWDAQLRWMVRTGRSRRGPHGIPRPSPTARPACRRMGIRAGDPRSRSRLHADSAPLGGCRTGLPEGTTVIALLGAVGKRLKGGWARCHHASRFVRDAGSVSTGGPWGPAPSPDAACRAASDARIWPRW